MSALYIPFAMYIAAGAVPQWYVAQGESVGTDH
jgi:hypothetical protein